MGNRWATKGLKTLEMLGKRWSIREPQLLGHLAKEPATTNYLRLKMAIFRRVNANKHIPAWSIWVFISCVFFSPVCLGCPFHLAEKDMNLAEGAPSSNLVMVHCRRHGWQYVLIQQKPGKGLTLDALFERGSNSKDKNQKNGKNLDLPICVCIWIYVHK